MPDTLTTNLTSAAVIGGTGTVADILAAINGMTFTYWSVSDYDAGNGTLELEPTADLTSMRVLLFGGQVPDADAIRDGATANATYLYIGVSPNANTTGPENDYTTGAPYTTGDWCRANIMAVNNANNTRVQAVETEEFIFFVVYNPSVATSVRCGMAGAIGFESGTTTRIYGSSGNGIGTIQSGFGTSSWWTTNTGIGMIPSETGPSATDSAGTWVDSTNTTREWYRETSTIENSGNLKNLAGTNISIGPILMVDPDQSGIVGNLRQMGWGE